MRFYFRNYYIDVSEYFFDTVINRVKNGEDFNDVYKAETKYWGDDFGLIENKIRKIVMKRVKEN